jgi:hypothetical protein
MCCPSLSVTCRFDRKLSTLSCQTRPFFAVCVRGWKENPDIVPWSEASSKPSKEGEVLIHAAGGVDERELILGRSLVNDTRLN